MTPRQASEESDEPLYENPKATQVLRDRLGKYRATQTTKAPGVDDYLHLNYYWIEAALRALKKHPSLIPVALVLGHLPAFLVAPQTRKRQKAGQAGELTEWSPFLIQAKKLALFGLKPEQVGRGIQILKKARLVKSFKNKGRPTIISVRCGPKRLKALRDECLERLRVAKS